jgi:hypothetical protein
MAIRSYRRVFDIERRLYRIDRLRLNPGGIPVRAFVYFIVILLGVVLFSRAPLIGGIARIVPWYLRVIALPALTAGLLTLIRIEGRPFHISGRALARHWLSSRWRAGVRPAQRPGTRWYPPDVVFLPDGSDGRMRHLRYTGPGAVLLAIEHEREGAAMEQGPVGYGRAGLRPTVVIRAAEGRSALRRGQVIELAAGVRLLVRSQSRR